VVLRFDIWDDGIRLFAKSPCILRRDGEELIGQRLRPLFIGVSRSSRVVRRVHHIVPP